MIIELDGKKYAAVDFIPSYGSDICLLCDYSKCEKCEDEEDTTPCPAGSHKMLKLVNYQNLSSHETTPTTEKMAKLDYSPMIITGHLENISDHMKTLFTLWQMDDQTWADSERILACKAAVKNITISMFQDIYQEARRMRKEVK